MLNPKKLLLIALIWFCKSTSLPKLNVYLPKKIICLFNLLIYLLIILFIYLLIIYLFNLLINNNLFNLFINNLLI